MRSQFHEYGIYLNKKIFDSVIIYNLISHRFSTNFFREPL